MSSGLEVAEALDQQKALPRKTVTRKERAAQTEAALKTAARAVFAERGYLNAKITDITTAAGRAAGSFYNHFASKEEVLTALLADVFAAGDDDVLDPESGHSSDFTDPAAIRWHVVAYWEFSEQHADLLAALSQAALVDESFAKQMSDMVAVQQQDLLGHLRYVTDSGARLPGDPVATMIAMFDMITSFRLNWQRSAGFGGTVSQQQAIDLLTTFVHRGLNGA